MCLQSDGVSFFILAKLSKNEKHTQKLNGRTVYKSDDVKSLPCDNKGKSPSILQRVVAGYRVVLCGAQVVVS